MKATEIVENVKGMPYEEHLRKLKLPTMAYQRARGLMMEVWKYINSYDTVAISPEYRKYTTINTPQGLYQYTRLPYGASSSPAVFQRIMNYMLKGIDNVCVYLDDILISGADSNAQSATVNRVLSTHGVCLR